MSKQKAIYILGAGALGLNIIKWAKEADLYTIVTDMNKEAPGFKLADKAFCINILNIDEHLDNLKYLAGNFNIVGAYCGIELGLNTLYHIHQYLNLNYLSKESLNIVQDKVKMKNIWQKNTLSTPIMTLIKDSNELTSFLKYKNQSFIIKPSTGSGSRGVQLINNKMDLEEVFKQTIYSVNDKTEVILEEYIQGRSIDVNGIFINNIFYPAGILEKYETSLPDFLPIAGNDPANISKSEEKIVYNLFENGCRLLGITQGPVKGDLIRSLNGTYYLLEISPRFHGDVTTSNTLPFGSKINPIKFYFNFLKNNTIETSFIKPKLQQYATWRVITLPPGIIKKHMNTKKHHPQITKIWLNPKMKSHVDKYTNTTAIPGYICAYGKDKEEVETILTQYFIQNNTEIIPNKKHIKWYNQLALQIQKHGFPKSSFGYQQENNKDKK